MPPLVEIRDVAKCFRMGHHRSFASRLRDRIGRQNTFDRDNPSSAHHPDFWAVRDLSFEVHAGEALALIGPNGAGKSTALKMLAGIMPPTKGSIHVRGRVSALIEVGAGFHPDLSGRENIFLNAAVLGLTQAQTRRAFDEIVDFAGIGDFLDTPLKHYSSGMHARLGFAVAAHVQPDVLLVDEVLSVGDRVFRDKCMHKMRSFLARGVAIIFVSHDLPAVSGFCDRAVLLVGGRPVFCGPAVDAIARYQATDRCESLERETANGLAHAAQICNEHGEPQQVFGPGERMHIHRTQADSHFSDNAAFRILIQRVSDQTIVFASRAIADHPESGPSGVSVTLNLPPGEYDACCVPSTGEAPPEFESAGASRFLIRGRPTSGGVVNVFPTFHVTTA